MRLGIIIIFISIENAKYQIYLNIIMIIDYIIKQKNKAN